MVLSRLAPAMVALGEVSYDCRWTGRRGQIAMECVGCSSGAVTERPDQTAQGYRRFRCRDCDKQFNERSDGLERCALRPGNVYSADGWCLVLEPVIARYRDTVKRLYFRAFFLSSPPSWWPTHPG
jgi:hypothetical protein